MDDVAALPANLPECLQTPALANIRASLDRLGDAPPQTLLLEGGTEKQRLAVALYWAARINCPQALASPGGSPCLACPTCGQIASGEYIDLLLYDGRISNDDARKNPGPIKTLNMETVRELKRQLRDTPHGKGLRVVLLMGLTQKRIGAANGLLKSLEEPSATTRFALLTPQREQLLPTLVSRSFCLTLPWTDSHAHDASLEKWGDALASFLQNGRGFLEKAAARNAVDTPLAQAILLSCQKSVARVLAGEASTPLDMAFAALDARGHATCCRWFSEAQEMLGYQTTPALVLQALAMRLFALRRDTRGASFAPAGPSQL